MRAIKRKRARIEIQPRFKIQYPMKNRCEGKCLLPDKQAESLMNFEVHADRDHAVNLVMGSDG
jgi:hypothetical protein